MQKMRVQGVIPPADINGIITMANLSDEEVAEMQGFQHQPKAHPSWATITDDIATLKRWMRVLAKTRGNESRPQLRRLILEINQALKGITMRPHVDPETLQMAYPDGVESWETNRAAMAMMIAQMFHDGTYSRVRICKECDAFFVSPLSRGRRREFCSTTHANTYKTREYRERRALQENSQP